MNVIYNYCWGFYNGFHDFFPNLQQCSLVWVRTHVSGINLYAEFLEKSVTDRS